MWKILGIILHLGQLSEAVRNFDIIFDKSNCSVVSTDYVVDYNCPIVQLSRSQGNYLSGNVVFGRNITKLLIDFRIHIHRKGQTGVEVMLHKIDGCKLATYKSRNPVVSSILKKLRSDGNFPKTCPFMANVNYTVPHFAMNPDFFPLMTPEMSLSLIINKYMGKVHFMSAEIMASIVKKGKS